VQNPWFVDKLRQCDAAPASPRALRTGNDDTHPVKEKFEVDPLLVNGTESPGNQEIDVTLLKLIEERLGKSADRDGT
jgi:hypothetical protein